MEKISCSNIYRYLNFISTVLIIISSLALFIIIWTRGEGIRINLFNFSIIKIHNPTNPFLIILMSAFLKLVKKLTFSDILVIATSIITGVLIGELILRIIDVPIAKYSYLQLWRRPSNAYGWELVPLAKGTDRLGNPIFINSHGLRDRERTWNKPMGVFRILAVGDSFTFGLGLDIEDTYVKQIEYALKKEGLNVDVINGGVIGYNLWQILEYVKNKGIKYEPDIIVYFFFLDDVGGIKSEKDANRVAKELEESYSKIKNSKFNFYFYNLLRNSANIFSYKYRSFLGGKWLGSISERKECFSKSNLPYLECSFDLNFLEDSLIQFKYTSDKYRTNFLIVIIPDSVQLHKKEWQCINKIVIEKCNMLGIEAIDMTPIFEMQKDSTSLYLFPLDAHTSSKAAKIIAESVVEKLKELRWLEK